MDFATNLPKQQKLKKHDEVNESWNPDEQLRIPKIYNRLEYKLENSNNKLGKAQNQPSTYEVLKNEPSLSQEILSQASKNSGNYITSTIDDLAHITAQSIKESTRNPVKIEGYETPFFKKT